MFLSKRFGPPENKRSYTRYVRGAAFNSCEGNSAARTNAVSLQQSVSHGWCGVDLRAGAAACRAEP